MAEVHTKSPDDSSMALALDRDREARNLALMENKPGFDLALISDEDFEAGLQRIKIRQVRLQRIIKEILIPEVHFQTKDNKGNVIFEKPHLTIAGGSELRNQFRLVCKPIEPPAVTIQPGFVTVSVTVGCYDSAGRLLGARSGACNTLERRFRKRGGSGWTYDDPREAVHQCTTMAEKRGAKLITAEVTGAVAFFANEDAMEAALGEDEAAPEPWSELDKKMVYARAGKIGIRSGEEFAAFAREVLGRQDIGFIGAADVKLLLEAIESRKSKGQAAGQPEARTAEDDEFEKRLARE
ncbi:MAG: hypothetical protein ACREMZ_15705 [Gemmatimonadales bacterium]